MSSELRILLVEDERDGQEVVAGLLEFGSITTDFVGTAEEALELLAQSQDYAAVIIDIALPGMSGIDLMRSIKRDDCYTRLPCIAITAYHASSVRREAMEAGFDAYFSKPLDDRHFVKEVVQIIGNAA